jgi:hypothetical protein
VQEARREEQMKVLGAQTTAFYDSLTDEEPEEERAWDALGEQELAALDLGDPFPGDQTGGS